MSFRHIALDGPPGGGKTILAERLAARLDAALILDDTENPFLGDFHQGRSGAAFQAQLFFLLARHRQQQLMRQGDLFSQVTVCDYLFDKDKIYAYLLLDDNELFIYQRLYDLLAADVAPPDLVVYLQTPADLLRRRLDERVRRDAGSRRWTHPLDERELVDAYNHFFFHYSATPLLVVETSHVDRSWGDEAVDDLLRQLQTMGRGTRYYVPRTE